MGTDSIIYIRTDANPHLSTGHLVRCISIAQSIISLGKSVCFLLSDSISMSLAKAFLPTNSFGHSLQLHQLSSAPFHQPEDELEELSTLFTTNQATKPTLLVDSYSVTPTYLTTLRRLVNLAYIDDLQKFDYPVDLLINYDLLSAEEQVQLKQFYTHPQTLLLGPAYTPLRQQFTQSTPAFNHPVQHLLITSGGSDPFSFCLHFVLRWQQAFPDPGSSLPNLHVVIGKLFSQQEKQDLYALSRTQKNLYLHEGLTDLAPLMKTCDLAVSAAGTTLCELCALGIPAISFTMADNQLAFAQSFHQKEAVLYAGDLREGKDQACLTNILQSLDWLISHPEQRIEQAKRGRALIDGKGALRIAAALCSLSTPKPVSPSEIIP